MDSGKATVSPRSSNTWKWLKLSGLLSMLVVGALCGIYVRSGHKGLTAHKSKDRNLVIAAQRASPAESTRAGGLHAGDVPAGQTPVTTELTAAVKRATHRGRHKPPRNRKAHTGASVEDQESVEYATDDGVNPTEKRGPLGRPTKPRGHRASRSGVGEREEAGNATTAGEETPTRIEVKRHETGANGTETGDYTGTSFVAENTEPLGHTSSSGEHNLSGAGNAQTQFHDYTTDSGNRIRTDTGDEDMQTTSNTESASDVTVVVSAAFENEETELPSAAFETEETELLVHTSTSGGFIATGSGAAVTEQIANTSKAGDRTPTSSEAGETKSTNITDTPGDYTAMNAGAGETEPLESSATHSNHVVTDTGPNGTVAHGNATRASDHYSTSTGTDEMEALANTISALGQPRMAIASGDGPTAMDIAGTNPRELPKAFTVIGYDPHTRGRPPTVDAGHDDITKPPPSRAPMICVFGDELRSWMKFPPDGLCDYIFFDAMEKEGGNKLGGPYQENFRHFLDMAAVYTTSEFGVGFEYTSWSTVHKLIKEPDAERQLRDLVTKKIAHFGFLNTHVYNFGVRDLIGLLQILKTVSALMEYRRIAMQPCHTVLATALPDREWMMRTLRGFGTIFLPDILISIGTLFVDDSAAAGCLTLPANFLSVPPSPAYFFSMGTALDGLNEMRVNEVSSVMAISLALSGRWYAPAYPDPHVKDRPGNFSLLQRCAKIPEKQMDSIVKVCKNTSFSSKVVDRQQNTAYVYSKDLLRMFVYDDEETFRYKVCTSKKEMTAVRYGLAVYGLEHADGNGMCGGGSYPRLHALKATLDFITNKFHDPAAVEECLNATETTTAKSTTSSLALTTETASATTAVSKSADNMEPTTAAKPSTTTTGTATVASKTTTPEPRTPVPLICTLTDQLLTSMKLPEDGLCDFVFFDSLEKHGGSTIAGPPNEGFELFLEAAAKHHLTQFGVGLDYLNYQKVEKIMAKPETTAHLRKLWDLNISHYGILNTQVYDYSMENVSSLLHILQKVSVFLKEQQSTDAPVAGKAQRKGYTFLASGFATFQFTSETARRMNDIYTPDYVVGIGHLFQEDKNFADCRIVPPNLRFVPPEDSYFYSLETAVEALHGLRSSGLRFKAAVSVAMFGRWYKPRHPDPKVTKRPGHYGALQLCTSIPEFQLDSIVKVCTNPSYSKKVFVRGLNTEYVFNKTLERTFIYDTEESLRYKLCGSKVSWTSFSYGFAAYNIEYSDGTNLCGRGQFARLRSLKRVLRYFDEKFTSPDQYDSCANKTIHPQSTTHSPTAEPSLKVVTHKDIPGANKTIRPQRTTHSLTAEPSLKETAVTAEFTEKILSTPTETVTVTNTSKDAEPTDDEWFPPPVTQGPARRPIPSGEVTSSSPLHSVPRDVSTQRVGSTTHVNGTSKGSSSASVFDGRTTATDSMSVATRSMSRHGGSSTQLSSVSFKAGDHSSTAGFPSMPYGNRSSAGRTESIASVGSMSVSSAQSETKSGEAEVTKPLPELSEPIPSQPPPPLICVFEDRMNTTMEFPEDGLCDYVFYSPFEPNNGMGLTGPFNDKLKHFLVNAMTQEATQYGLGLDFNRIADHKQVLERPDALSILENITKRGISHFGYLNTIQYGFGKQHLKAMLTNLKELSEVLSPKRTALRPIYTVLALGLPTFGWVRMTAKYFERYFKPDIVVSLAHLVVEDKHLADCTIMPPTFLYLPYAKSYAYSLMTAHQAVKEMKHLSPNVTMAVSVGLYGRWYKPSNGKTLDTSPHKKYSVQKECADITEFQLGNVADVCKSPNYQKTYYDEAHHAMVAYNEDLERMFVYDDEKALNAKLCRAKQFYYNFKYGVAAYNLEYADGSDVCGTGEFPRIRALRRITKSLAQAFKSPLSVKDCPYDDLGPYDDRGPHDDRDSTKQVPTATRHQTPLICVFSDRLQPPMKLPTPGLCDYVYFDSMELKSDTTGMSGTLQKSFQYFLMLALENKMRAAYGIGFNYQSLKSATAMFESAETKREATYVLHRFWARGITHFAYLNAPATHYNMNDFKMMLSVLKHINNELKVKGNALRPVETTVATVLADEKWTISAKMYLREVFTPNNLIVIGHYFTEDKQFEDCLIVPPTFHLKPPAETYFYTLDTAHEQAEQLATNAKKMVVVVSVSMAGRWYQPTYPDPNVIDKPGNYSFFKKCDDFEGSQTGDITEVCRNASYKNYHDNGLPADMYYSKSLVRLLAYNGRESLREQLCTNKVRLSSKKYGIAVYDAQYDDSLNLCGRGSYHRISTLKGVVDALRSSAPGKTSAEDLENCLNHTDHISTESTSASKVEPKTPVTAAMPTSNTSASLASAATTTKTLTGSSIVSTTQEPTTREAMTPPEDRAPSSPFICIFSDHLDVSISLPEDGLCDFVFFDAIHKKGGTLLQGPFKENFAHFLSAAAQQINTKYGVGFDYGNYQEVRNILMKPNAPHVLRALTTRGIRHFGFLNTEVYHFDSNDLKALIVILKRLSDVLSELAHTVQPMYTVLATSFGGTAWVPVASHMFRTIYTPDMVISIGHFYSEDRKMGGCLIVPPTFLYVPPNSTYYYSLTTAHEVVQQLFDEGVRTSLSVSVGMYGRWYKPLYSDPDEVDRPGNYSLLQSCANIPESQVDSIRKVCKNVNFTRSYHDNFLHADVLYNKTAQRLFTYDSSLAFSYKLCRCKRELTKYQYGIAAFNVEDSDDRNVCGHGSYSRLQTLRAIVEFCRTKYQQASDYKHCFEQTKPKEQSDTSAKAPATTAGFEAMTPKEQPATSAKAPAATTASSTGSGLPTPKPPLAPPLICTFGDAMTENTPWPEDGLCDYLFYTALGKKGGSQLSGERKSNFNRFLVEAMKQFLTSYGVGFDYGNREEIVKNVATEAARADLNTLWNNGISHFGVLNTEVYYYNSEDLTTLLEILNHVSKALKLRSREMRTMHTVLALPLATTEWRRVASKAFRSIYMPDIIVSIGHFFSQDREMGGCRIVPPTFVYVPPTADYYYSLMTAHEAVTAMYSLRVTARMAVSVGMFGRWYKPLEPDPEVKDRPGQYSILEKCAYIEEDQIGSLPLVCKNSNFSAVYNDPVDHAKVAYNKTLERLFVYDDDEGLRYKLCLCKRFFTSAKYGIAAYNLEHGDGAEACGLGPYHRIHTLKEILRFINNQYESPSDFTRCLNGEKPSPTPRTDSLPTATSPEAPQPTRMHSTASWPAGSKQPATTTQLNAITGQSTATTPAPHVPPMAAPLICVFGRRTRPTAIFPEDGLCDYTFFDSFETSAGASSGVLRGRAIAAYTAQFETFLTAASKCERTQFGVGFDSKNYAELQALPTHPSTRQNLDNLWNRKVFHYGFLNVDDFKHNDADLESMLLALKELASWMNTRRTPARAAHTILAMNFNPHFLELMRNENFIPDILVSLGHFFHNDQAFPKCFIVPPTYLKYPAENTYPISMRTAHDRIRQYRAAGIDSTMAVSVTMYGRWYKPMWSDPAVVDKPGNYGVRHRCTITGRESQLGSILELCTNKTSKTSYYDDEEHATVMYNKEQQFTFVYDDPVSLRYKLCTCKSEMIGYEYGVAIYDMEGADDYGVCGNGTFFRLKDLRSTLDFIRDTFTSQQVYENCIDPSKPLPLSTRGVPTTVQATVPPVNVDKPLQSPLICTFGINFTANTPLPDDGLCDYIFYTTMDSEGGSSYSIFKEDFLHFLSAASGAHSKTKYGVGFNYDNREQMKQTWLSQSGDKLLELWKRGISLFGYLDTPPNYFNMDSAKSLLLNIKGMVELLRPAAVGRRPFTVFSAVIARPLWGAPLAKAFQEIYQPDIVVSLGHYYMQDKEWEACMVVPPTLLEPPSGNAYFYSLGTAHEAVRDIADAGAQVVVAPSVALFGRWYKPYSADDDGHPGNYRIFQECDDIPEYQMDSFTKICHNDSFTKSQATEVHSQFFYSKALERIFTYDNGDTYVYKLGHFKKKLTDFKYGLAAYGLEFADANNSCGLGKYHEIRVLRQLLSCFEKKYSAAADMDNCLHQTFPSQADDLANEDTTSASPGIDPSKPLPLSTRGVPTTVQATVPPVNVDKPLQSPLICTFGINFTANTPLPDDGLCDYIFYTTMDSEGGSSYSIFKEDFLHFLSAASGAHSKTKYGVGFNYDNREQMKQTWLSQSGDKLLELWKRGISLFGYLDTPPNYFNMDSAKSLLLNIKGMVELLRPAAVGRRPFTVFSAVIARPLWGAPLAKAFQEIYQPDIVVSLGHYYMQDKEWEACMVVPPTLLEPPSGNAYFYSLGTAHEAVRDIADAGAQVVVAPSVALFGRWYKPYSADDDGSPGNYRIFQECDDIPEYQMDSFTKICHNDSFTKSQATEVHSQFFYSKALERIFTYDNGDTYVYKLGHFKKKLTDFKYGLAAYGLEFADANNSCGLGKYHEIRVLRQLLSCFEKKYSAAADMDNCLHQTFPSQADDLANEDTTSASPGIDPSKPQHLSTRGVPITVQPTVPPVNVDKPLQSPLICTFGINFTANTPLPDDGLCDYIFYTTMDSEGGSSYSIFKEDFLHFLSAASGAHSKTKYGVGFNYDNREQMKQTWLSQSGDKLLELWKRGISLFGYLDTPPNYFNMDSAKSLLLNIKGMVELLRPAAVGRRPFTVFSAVIARPLWGAPLAKAFQEIYQPDIVVSLGHYYMQDKEWEACMVVPPTLLEPPSGNAYFYSLGTAHEAVRDIADAGAQVVVAPSVALFGRWYKPYSADDDGSPGNYRIFQECDDIPEYQMDSFTKICHNDSFTKSQATEVHSQFFYSKALERIFTYDNGDTYVYKLGHFKKKLTDFKYGLAAYGLEFADANNSCGLGKYHEIRVLRQLLSCFEKKYSAAADMDNCLHQTFPSQADDLANEDTTSASPGIDPSKPLLLSTRGVPTTVQPTVPPVNVDKPLQSPLICTFGINFTANTPLPDDGLCDYIFYTTMDSEGGSSYSIFKEDFLHFLSAASGAHSKTKYGVGFNYDNREQMKQTWLSQSGDKLLELWKRGISLFGYLDIPAYYFNMDSAKSLLLNIKGMVELLRPAAVGRRPFTVFSAVIARPLWGSPLAKAFQEIYQPDIVVSLGHYYMQDKEWEACMVVPPTLLEPPSGNAYFYSLGTAHEAVRDIANAGAQVVVAPSVALFGRWYKPYSADDDGSPGNYRIFQECDNIPEYQMDSFAKICHNDSFTKSQATEVHSQFFYSKDLERIFTYDNGDTYVYKLGHFKQKLIDFKYGLAAYGLEFADANNSCGLGKYHEIRVLRQLLSCFERNYSAAADMNNCLHQTFPSQANDLTNEDTTSASPVTAAVEKPLEAPLICTFGVNFSASTPFPEDGLCDYLFYTTFDRDGGSSLETFQEDFLHFLTEASAVQSKTKYGVGFDYSNRDKTKRTLHEPVGAKVRDLWERGISLFGYLNTSPFYMDRYSLTQMLLNIKSIAELLRPIAIGRPFFTVFAAVASGMTEASRLSKVIQETYTPDIIVPLGHYFMEDKDWSQCLTIPPTLIYAPPYRAYYYSLTTAHDAIKQMADAGMHVVMAPSVAMFGRWYKPYYPDPSDRPGPGNYTLFQECDFIPAYQMGSVAEVCKNDSFYRYYESRAQADVYYNKKLQRMFFYDNGDSYRYKLCYLKQTLTNTKYGLAAYDLEFADAKNTCGLGSYHELRVLRELLSFFNASYSSPRDFDNCLHGANESLVGQARKEIPLHKAKRRASVGPRHPPESPLICTVADTMRTSMSFPEDGLCDYVFFDSIDKVDGSMPLMDPSQGSFVRFLMAAARQDATDYGVGFDYENRENTKQALASPGGKALLQNLFYRGVSHFGYVNTPVHDYGTPELRTLLEILKMVSVLMHRQTDPVVFTALATKMYTPVWTAATASLFKKIYTPDIVVSIAHYFVEDKNFEGGLIVPPTLLDSPSDIYFHSLGAAHASVEGLARSGIIASLAVSVAMFGRWYRPLYPDPQVKDRPGNYSLLSLCSDMPGPQLGSVVEVCKNLSYTNTYHDSKLYAEVAYNKGLERLFTYDDDESFRQKLCLSKSNHTGVQYGVAAYNLEKDDTENACGQGSFARLRTLRKLVDFFKDSFSSAKLLEECLEKSFPTTVKVPPPPMPLICTVGDGLKPSMIFPEDGLCDYTFFDSLEKQRGATLAGPYTDALKRFLDASSKSVRTQYGAGFDYVNSRRVKDLLSMRDTISHLDSLWNRGVSHYGVVNTQVYSFGSEKLDELLAILEALSQIMDEKSRVVRPSYTILATPVMPGPWTEVVTDRFKRMYAPDIVVSLSHYFYEDRDLADCVMVPPTFLKSPPSRDYIYSMETAHESIRVLLSSGVNASMAVSVAMFGRWYKPLHPDPEVKDRPGNYSLFQSCDYIPETQLGFVSKVCRDPRYRHTFYDHALHARVTYNKATERLFVYDDAQSLRYKLCLSRAQYSTIKYGVAVYNLEYANDEGSCGNGIYSRLRTVRHLLSFFQHNFTSPSDADRCFVYSPTPAKTPEPPMPKSPLICTFGELTSEATVVPEDGLCDYTFYDSLQKQGGSKLAGPFEPGFERFLEISARHSKTEYGVGLDYGALGELEVLVQERSTKVHLDNMFSRKLYHFGFVNTAFYYFNFDKLESMLNVLKKVSDLMDDRRSPTRPIYTVIAVALISTGWVDAAVSEFRKTFTPDALVSVGHYFSEDKNFMGCLAVPPTLLDVPPSDDYYYSLNTAHQAAKMVDDKLPNMTKVVSVAMFGRWYRPLYPDPEVVDKPGSYSPLQACSMIPESQIGNIADVCAHPRYTASYHDNKTQSQVLYSKKAERMFIYDDSASMRSKLCRCKSRAKSLRYGLAAYNLECADGANRCQRGSYSRLRTLRHLLAFFKQGSSSYIDIDACVRDQ
ncbi:uncharacterized protein [Dermacentor albipictus]|uniref:uncharacterized protein isoform X3 n=1 Tax=Dermacentor albipictus TaxID=60249 RepID=UPI0038FC8913